MPSSATDRTWVRGGRRWTEIALHICSVCQVARCLASEGEPPPPVQKMVWEREAEFSKLLKDVTQRPSRSALEALTTICVEDHASCYKAAPALLERALRGAKGSGRLHILYAVSKLLRTAKRDLRGRDRFGAHFSD